MTRPVGPTRARRSECGAIVSAIVLLLTATASAQQVSLEYQVKAAYLFNFTKFVEWPAEALPKGAPLTICVAVSNPFGQALEDTIKGELVDGRALTTRVVRDPAGCHVLFVPEGVAAAALLRDARTRPILTVGETDDFQRDGGVVNFVMQDGKVRFDISPEAASRAQLRISSRLLRLRRNPGTK